MPTVTFTEPWGERSWHVTHTCPLYENGRPPHVEVIGNADIRPGLVYELTNCHVHRKAIMWDVVGCTNDGAAAHFTVGFFSTHQQALDALPRFLA